MPKESRGRSRISSVSIALWNYAKDQYIRKHNYATRRFCIMKKWLISTIAAAIALLASTAFADGST